MAEAIKRVLWWSIVATKGGLTRGRIILALKEKPMNANQLASALGIDYRAIRHHLNILVKNRLLITYGEKYGIVYYISPNLESNYKIFLEIWTKIGQK